MLISFPPQKRWARRCWRRTSWSSSPQEEPAGTTARTGAFQRLNPDEIDSRRSRCKFRQEFSDHFSAVLRRSDAPLAQAAPCRHGVSGFAAGQELDLSRGVPGRGHPWELKSGEVLLETLWLSRKPSISALHHTKCQMAKCPDAGKNSNTIPCNIESST